MGQPSQNGPLTLQPFRSLLLDIVKAPFVVPTSTVTPCWFIAVALRMLEHAVIGRSPTSTFLLRAVEEQFDVTAQVIDRFGCELGSTGGFRKNESALQHRLSVQSQAASGPSGLDAVCFHGSGYIRFDLLGMTADRAGASIADRRMAVVGFLHHCAHEAGELRH